MGQVDPGVDHESDALRRPGPAVYAGDAPTALLRRLRRHRLADDAEVQRAALDRVDFLVLLAISDVRVAALELGDRARVHMRGKAADRCVVDVPEGRAGGAVGFGVDIRPGHGTRLEHANVAVFDLVPGLRIARGRTDHGCPHRRSGDQIKCTHENPPF